MPVRYLRSKLMAPRLHPGSVSRPRLTEPMRDTTAPVWLLSAPAGYGKTTAITQALAARNGPEDHPSPDADPVVTAWLTIDRADNDPVRFWTHVAAALLGDGDELEAIVADLDPDRLDVAIDRMLVVVERRRAPTVLVLDDLHEITRPDIVATLARIITNPPAGLTVVISTRTDPDLPLGRLRAPGLLHEVRAQDLAFRVDEAMPVFADRDDRSVAAAVEQTEGWATGLRLLAMAGPPDATGTGATTRAGAPIGSDLGTYLAEEALSSLGPELQRFLIESSLLDELSPSLCDATLGRTGSLATLRELAKAQVFTELVDPAINLYRYHRIFRDFLRRRAEELDPQRLQTINSAAAEWYRAAADPTQTVRYAMAAGDTEMALTAIKANYGEYGQNGRIATIERWLELYGLDRSRQDPELRLVAGWVLVNVRRYDEIDAWLAVPDGEEPDASYLVQAGTIRSHRDRHLGDLDGATANAGAAVEATDDRVDDGVPDHSVGYAALALAAVLAGDDEPRWGTAAVQTGLAEDNESSIVIGYGALAAIASTVPERLDEAEALADQAMALAPTPVLERFHQPILPLLTKSRVAGRRGLLADAERLASRAETLAEEGREPLMLVLVRCQLARLANLAGHPDEARRHLRRAEAAIEVAPAALADELRRTGNEIRFAAGPTGGATVELSDRELAVLRLLPQGLTRRQLGEQLFVSENTIKTHLTSLRHKLGVSGRSDEIVRRATELGLLGDQNG